MSNGSKTQACCKGVESMGSFKRAFCRRINPRRVKAIADRTRKSPQGAHGVLGVFQIIMSLVYHVLQGIGTFGATVQAVSGRKLSESALSERRQSMAWACWEQVVEAFLGPRANPTQHPNAFYKGMRLVGADGTMFSVTNLPALVHALPKAISRRMKAAFAKLRVVTLVELGLHNPIGVKVGLAGESEQTLAHQLLGNLSNCLFIGDRLYGAAAVVYGLLGRKSQHAVEFLVRVSKCPKPRITQQLRDGSALVEIKFGKEGLVVREIRGRVCRRNGKWVSVRLWTSLLDCGQYPACELMELYGQRWEHEITYKELKRQLKGSLLLHSQTVPTAGQEVLALVMAHSVISEVRQLVAARTSVPVLQVSFPQDSVHGPRAVVCGGAGAGHSSPGPTEEAGHAPDGVPGPAAEPETPRAILPARLAATREQVETTPQQLAGNRLIPV